MKKSIIICKENKSIKMRPDNHFFEMMRALCESLYKGLHDRGYDVTINFTINQADLNLSIEYTFREWDVALQFSHLFGEDSCVDGWYELNSAGVVELSLDFPHKEFTQYNDKLIEEVFDILQ